MNKYQIFIIIIILSVVLDCQCIAQSRLKIVTTSSTEYLQKPGSSIYPAFVDGIKYYSWTETGNLAYYQLLADGGSKPYNWEIIQGSLPTGIILGKDGKLQGIPSKEGTYTFTVKVTDSKGEIVSKELKFVAETYRSKWMADAKFGIMIQWGAFTEPTLAAKNQIPVFEERIKKFDADKWAEQISKLGGKVLNFTVKAGDGIRLWPSVTPSREELKTKRNIVAELITACHKRGIKFVAYVAPDNSWNKVVTDVGADGSTATLNKGLIKELVQMGVDGLWIDMGASPELYKGTYDKWFPWDDIIPIIRANNPYTIFANNPGVNFGGTVLRWPHTDVLVYEGRMSSGEGALQVARPSTISKKVAIEVDNMLDNNWAWPIGNDTSKTAKPAEMIIKNIKANWAVGATYMLNYPIPADGEIMPPLYQSTLNTIGRFVVANQGWSEQPSAIIKNDNDTKTQTVLLKSKAGAEIYYTTDGSLPSKSSRRYSTPIKITKMTRVRALAVEPGKPASKILEKDYGIQNLPNNRSVRSQSFLIKKDKNDLTRRESKGYFRGMKITVGRRPIVIDQIGRSFVAGNKNNHQILIKRLFDEYPVLVTEIKSGSTKTEPDGFQYVSTPELKLEAGMSYLIASKEDNVDQFAANDFKKSVVDSNFRISSNAILSSTGDREPVENDGIGALLNLKYHLSPEKESINLALGSSAELLDNRDKPLIPTIEILYADNAVDGNNSTHAQAGGQYAWTLSVDLGKVEGNIQEAKIQFTKEAYATDFEVFYSKDGAKWNSLTRKTNNSDIGHSFKFPSIAARYFKIRSNKPDGPNQKGGQMGIAEFQLY